MTESSSSLVSGFAEVVPHNDTQTLVHYSLTTVKHTWEEDIRQLTYCDCFICIRHICIWPQTSLTVYRNKLYRI